MRCFIEEFFDERDTPATPGTGAVAFTDLAGSPGFVDPYEVADLPLGNVEAVTELVVRLHEKCLLSAWRETPQS